MDLIINGVLGKNRKKINNIIKKSIYKRSLKIMGMTWL